MRTLAVVLMITTTILICAVSVLAQVSTPFDPFLAYTDLLTKDQTLDALASRHFSCEFILLQGSQKCSWRAEDSYFSDISVTLVNGVPDSVSFYVVEDALRVGDLIMLWDQPENQTIHSLLSWPERDGMTAKAVVASADSRDYFTPVLMVSFMF